MYNFLGFYQKGGTCVFFYSCVLFSHSRVQKKMESKLTFNFMWPYSIVWSPLYNLHKASSKNSLARDHILFLAIHYCIWYLRSFLCVYIQLKIKMWSIRRLYLLLRRPLLSGQLRIVRDQLQCPSILYLLENKLLSKNKLSWKISAYRSLDKTLHRRLFSSKI